MPGIRTLAEELALSHNTVAKASTHLEQEGWVELPPAFEAELLSETPASRK
jgi:DNA-binding transcriptional regulator YhcF (GntR family)